MSALYTQTRRVLTALPGDVSGADRCWTVLLDCGHQVAVWGRVGSRPRRGAYVVCPKCPRSERHSA